MKKFRNLLSLALIVGLIASFAACTSSDDGKEKVTILYPNWVEAVAYLVCVGCGHRKTSVVEPYKVNHLEEV